MTTDEPETAIAAPASTPSPPSRRRRRRWPYVVGGVLVLIATAVVIVPTYVARHVIESEMAKRGLVIEGTETFHINVLKRQVWFGPVRVGVADAPLAKIDQFGVEARLLNLLRKRALIQRVLVSGVDVQITRETDGSVLVNGIDVKALMAAEAAAAPPADDAEPGEASGWGAGLGNFELYDCRIFVTDRQRGTVSLNLDRLVLEDFRMWEPDSPGRLALVAAINDILLRIEGTAAPFGDAINADLTTQVTGITLPRITRFTGPLGFERTGGSANVDLRHAVVVGRDGHIRLNTKGAITASDIDVSLPDSAAVALSRGVVDIDVAYAGNPAEKGTASGTVDVTLTGANPVAFGPTTIGAEETRITLADLDLTLTAGGDVKGTLLPTVAVSTARLAGPATAAVDSIQVALSRLAVDVTSNGVLAARTAGTTTVRAIAVEEPVQASIATVGLTLDDVSADIANAETRLNGRAALAVETVTAALPPTATQPPITAGFERLDMTIDTASAEVTPDRLTWQAAFDLVLAAITAQAAGGEAADVTIEGIDLTDFQVNHEPSVTGAELIVRRPVARVTNALLDAFSGTGKPAAEQTPAPPSDAALPAIRLDRFAIVDTGSVSFNDRSTKPDVNLTADIRALEVRDFSTVDVDQPLDLTVDVLVNEFSTVQALGTATPFKPKPDFDVTAKIARFQMPALSPYIAQALGANVRQGTLSVNADATAQAGQLNGKVTIEVDKLRFEGLSPAQRQQLSKTIGVPVETAVAIMEDANGLIRLDVPVSGDLTSPQFDITKIIGTAVVGAVTAAVTAPFNLLAKGGAAILGADGSGIRPITFQPGQATLDANAASVIDGLASLLKEKPNLSLQVCGRATAADLQVIAGRPAGGSAAEAARTAPQKMAALAEERTRVVRRAFIEERGLGTDRVAECRASADASDRQPPRTEIMF